MVAAGAQSQPETEKLPEPALLEVWVSAVGSAVGSAAAAAAVGHSSLWASSESRRLSCCVPSAVLEPAF